MRIAAVLRRNEMCTKKDSHIAMLFLLVCKVQRRFFNSSPLPTVSLLSTNSYGLPYKAPLFSLKASRFAFDF